MLMAMNWYSVHEFHSLFCPTVLSFISNRKRHRMKQFLAATLDISTEAANLEGDLCEFVEDGDVEVLASTLKFPSNFATKPISGTSVMLLK